MPSGATRAITVEARTDRLAASLRHTTVVAGLAGAAATSAVAPCRGLALTGAAL